MQKYRMLKSVKGVHDGQLHPVDFHEGTVHPIGDSLAQQFIELGAVELVEEEDTEEQEKSAGAAPANKSKAAAPANKSKKSEEPESRA